MFLTFYFYFRSQYIKDIRILSKNAKVVNKVCSTPEKTSPEHDNLSKNVPNSPLFNNSINVNSPTPLASAERSRTHRREWLRNIPNACTAYVCPDSPPLINRTAGQPGLHNYGSNNSNEIQHLDNSLNKLSVKESARKHRNFYQKNRCSGNLFRKGLKLK